jgi:hypothetical protein
MQNYHQCGTKVHHIHFCLSYFLPTSGFCGFGFRIFYEQRQAYTFPLLNESALKAPEYTEGFLSGSLQEDRLARLDRHCVIVRPSHVAFQIS